MPDLPNLLKGLYCDNNELKKLPKLPNSLKVLYLCHNKITSLPDLPDNIKLKFIQDIPINSISYYNNFNLIGGKTYYEFYTIIESIDSNLNIINYPFNPITNQQELNKYKEYQLYNMNRTKSARK